MLNLKDVDYVAELARLEFSDDEKKTFLAQMNRLLDYFKKLNQLNTDKIKSTSHVVELSNILKPDEVRPSFPREMLLDNAPEKLNGFFKVPKTV